MNFDFCNFKIITNVIYFFKYNNNILKSFIIIYTIFKNIFFFPIIFILKIISFIISSKDFKENLLYYF